MADSDVASGSTQDPFVRDVSTPAADPIVFTFGTLVTDLVEYHEMVAAFRGKGFDTADCEFLYVDNSSSNRLDAFGAYNRFLLEARGRYVVLCHQDVLPLDDDRRKLETLLADLDARDPRWALCGNAGGVAGGGLAVRITHGAHHAIRHGGPFPVRVISLDENFIVVRRDANLALSRDLVGFHWYGSDLCTIADVLGWTAWVIEFHLFHKSTGNIRGDFGEKRLAFQAKYARAFRSRWLYVPTRQHVYLSESPMRSRFARIIAKLKRILSKSND